MNNTGFSLNFASTSRYFDLSGFALLEGQEKKLIMKSHPQEIVPISFRKMKKIQLWMQVFRSESDYQITSQKSSVGRSDKRNDKGVFRKKRAKRTETVF